jgi:hypothetical protein
MTVRLEPGLLEEGGFVHVTGVFRLGIANELNLAQRAFLDHV